MPERLMYAHHDDVSQAAKERARREKTTGEVISELARSALTAPPRASSTPASKSLYGFRPFPRHGGIVTNELIDKLREDDAY